MRVLLVEDHDELAYQVQRRMKQSGFAVDRVATIRDAVTALSSYAYALAVMDRKLPDGDSLSILPQIRYLQPSSRILILSAMDGVDQRVNGLDAGADDYLTKPFDLDEMMARIRASLRRQGGEATTPPVRIGRLSFDLSTRSATVEGRPIVFRQKELVLLEALARRVGRIVERETLISEIWGFDDDVRPHALTIIASRLRSRLEEAGAGVELQMVRGVGYFITGAEG